MKERTNNLYDGIEVYSPKGKLMFRCYEKKKNWYLKRNLAIPYKENSIILTFEPSGNGESEDVLNIPRINMCAECGSVNLPTLTKHHIVPHNFVKHTSIKKHASWLIVPLCENCHYIYEEKALIVKKELCRKYNIEFNDNKTNDYMYITRLLNKVEKDTSDLLNTKVLRHMSFFEKKYNISYYDHNVNSEKEYSQQIIEIINDENKIMSIWIEHFLSNMSLFFLPQEHKNYLSSKI